MLATDAYVRLNAGGYAFGSVLDVCDGNQEHSHLFRTAGKMVTTIDIRSADGYLPDGQAPAIEEGPFDLVWSSHVLQKSPNANLFIASLADLCHEGGTLAITVPVAKPQLFGGDVSQWTPALLVYNLVLAGLNCSDVRIKTYGGNISAIVRKQRIKLPKLQWEPGDLGKLQPFLPSRFAEGMNHDIAAWNW